MTTLFNTGRTTSGGRKQTNRVTAVIWIMFMMMGFTSCNEILDLFEADTPTITTQPQAATYSQNATAAALTVTAKVNDDGTLSYQWYNNTANSTKGGTAVGTNSSNYTPTTTGAGTTYYYVVVTNTWKGGSESKAASATSNVAAITVNEANTSPTDAQRPSITAQPQGANYSQNAAASALRVIASVSDGGTLSYQWYRNTTNSASGGTTVGTNSSSYTPTTTVIGTIYYYVVVTNTNNNAKGAKTVSTTSNVAAITVNEATTTPTDAQRPSITAQPQGANYSQNATASALRVTASVSDGGTLSYQWYRNTTNSASGGTAVGTNNSSFTPPTTAAGTTYYYVVVTNTNNNVKGAKTATSTSTVATVTINAGGNDTGGGKIDQKLIGTWVYSPDNEIYKFSADGSFNHFSLLSATEGKFTTSDNKVYFSNIIYEKGETWEKKYPDAVYEYEVGKDNDGDYLKISLFLYGVTYVKLPTGYKFRKQK